MALSTKKFLIGLGLLFFAIFGGVGGLLLFAFSRGAPDNVVANEALLRAEANAALVEVLGSPLKLGFGGTTSVSREGEKEQASYDGPIEGPKGRGTLHAVGFKFDRGWEYVVLEIESGGRTFELLAPVEARP